MTINRVEFPESKRGHLCFYVNSQSIWVALSSLLDSSINSLRSETYKIAWSAFTFVSFTGNVLKLQIYKQCTATTTWDWIELNINNNLHYRKNYKNLIADLLRLSLHLPYCCRFALHIICLSGIPTTLETRQDGSLDYVLARRMTRISAAKIICIHNKLTKSQSSHEATHFRSELFQLLDIFRFCDFLIGGTFTALVLFFVQSKRRLLHKRFIRKKCVCYVIQRQTRFSLHNNWAIIPDRTTIEHRSETDTKMNTTIVVDTFDWRLPNMNALKWGKNRWRTACDW